MKKATLFILVLLFLNTFIVPQIVKGKLVDENSNSMSQVQLELFSPGHVYTANSLSDGSFSFNITTNVDDNNLPSDYSVSEFYPNPFNPKTRVAITLPTNEIVKVEVFNTLGQKVKETSEQSLNAGTNYIDIELSGSANGMYVSRITIGEKYTLVKKLMLIYGSQHLITNPPAINPETAKVQNNKLSLNLDSLTATSGLMWKKTFLNLPVFTGDSLDLGNLVVERYCPGTPTVTYAGKTYNTVQIGNQCWLKENLDVGIFVASLYAIYPHSDVSNNGIIEKYCYANIPAYCDTFGGLYDWKEAMEYSTTSGAQGICPTGWHIPTTAEFLTLKTAVNNDSKRLKSVGQGTGSGAGTNTSGFSALLSGTRSRNGGINYLGRVTYFWNSTEGSSVTAYNMYLSDNYSDIYLHEYYKEGGFSVRCVKN